MALIFPFLDRLAGARDWSGAERARLADLAARLPGQSGVEAVFGRSETGEPWCVVTDADGEVLVHVARIDGKVVVHDLAADAMQEGDTLWSALEHLLGADGPDAAAGETGVVIPFPLDSRQAQTFIALLVAAAFASGVAAGSESHAEIPDPLLGDLSPAVPPPEEEPPPPAAGDPQAGKAPAPEPVARAAAAIAAATEFAAHSEDAGPIATAAPAQAAPPAEAPRAPDAGPAADLPAASEATTPQPGLVLTGTAGNDSLQGGAGADILRGGAGADTLDGAGAPKGGFDLLDGGAGDDRLVLRAHTLAVGGEGADTFVVAAPQQAATAQGAPPADATAASSGQALAIVLDFTAEDRLEFAPKVTVLTVTAVADILAGQTGAADAAFTLTAARVPATPGARIGLDFDGDGREDGYILLAGKLPPALEALAHAGDLHGAAPEPFVPVSSSLFE